MKNCQIYSEYFIKSFIMSTKDNLTIFPFNKSEYNIANVSSVL